MGKKIYRFIRIYYQSSEWYERSYKILNTNYGKAKLKDIKKQKSLLKKIQRSTRLSELNEDRKSNIL